MKESIGSGVAASVQALGVTSISFPGIGGASMSPSTSTLAASRGGSRSSHSPQVGDPLVELSAKENIVVTWDLRRRRDLAEFKRSVQPVGGGRGKVGRECVFQFVHYFRIID